MLWSSCDGAARCSVAGMVQPVVVLLDMVQSVLDRVVFSKPDFLESYRFRLRTIAYTGTQIPYLNPDSNIDFL